ncbi:MAG: DUF5681 domain-containing protein [Phycisphaerales bacterium]
MRSRTPSTNGRNGRDASGRFTKGNPGGPGNPHARRVQEIRSAVLDAVTAEDIELIVKALIRRAKSGDVRAARELLDRAVGKSTPPTAPDPSEPVGVKYLIIDGLPSSMHEHSGD